MTQQLEKFLSFINSQQEKQMLLLLNMMWIIQFVEMTESVRTKLIVGW